MPAAPARSPEQVILVVDDEEMVRQMTARMLQDAGFRVLEAHDGEEAVTLLETLGPDIVWLVVSDIAMLGLSGMELAKAVTERWPAIPVLLISSQGVPRDDFRPDALVAAARTLVPSFGGAAVNQESAAPPSFRAPWWDPRLPVS